ncbi:Uncharacterized protein SCF082_LOCUS1242 [Durusdinium trenchii]|uniref:Uncharacterized protein n=1 Tax=Durusdinium trenchii TaxID=1381693 RepID=A0ABP0HDJ7_9DINO
MNMLSAEGFANALHCVCNLKPGGGHMSAPVCSTWVFMSRGSTLRSRTRPLGRKDSGAVRDGNVLAARALVLCILAAAKGCFWLLEQPASSIMELHPLFQAAIRLLGMHRLCIAMGRYGAPTPKRTILYSSHACVRDIQDYEVEPEYDDSRQMVVKYVNQKGESRIHGGAHLKSSQAYPKQFGVALAKVRTKFAKRHRRQAMSFLRQARMSDREFDCRPRINRAWIAGYRLSYSPVSISTNMPDPSPRTPPRRRHRSKTPGSAQVPTRPSALRNPMDQRGREKERKKEEEKRGSKNVNNKTDPKKRKESSGSGKDAKDENDAKQRHKAQDMKGKEKGTDKEKKDKDKKAMKQKEAKKEMEAKMDKEKPTNEAKKCKGEVSREKNVKEVKEVKKHAERNKDKEVKTDKEARVEKEVKVKKEVKVDKETKDDKEKVTKKGADQRKIDKKEKRKKAKKEKRQKVKNDKMDKKKGKRGTKKERRIKYVPVKKHKIDHIFDKSEAEGTGTPSSSHATLSSKEKAEQKLKELTAIMAASDCDSDSLPATDMEDFLDQMDDGKDLSGGSEDEKDEQEEGGSSPMSDDSDEEEEEEGEESEEETGDEEEESMEEEGSGSEETEGDDDDEKEKEEEEEKKKGEAGEKGAECHALVPVIEASRLQVANIRNSVTNKKEWDVFSRQAKTKMPVELNDAYQQNKNDLFNMWLDNGANEQSWSHCVLEVKRKQKETNEAKKGWQAIQGKVLKQRYSEEKWEKVKKKRLESGVFYLDDDFPDDEDETWYFVKEGQSMTNRVETSEELKLAAQKNMDSEMLAAVTDANSGLMRVGALPKVSTASAAGNKALLEGIAEKAGVATAPKRKPKKEEEAVEVAPQTWCSKAAATLPELLKTAAEARTSSIKLSGLEFADDLASNLLKQAEGLEADYTVLSKTVKEALTGVTERMAALEKAQVAASAFLKKPKPKKQPKAKKKAGKDKK